MPTAGGAGSSVLHGRARECAALDRLLAEARSARSGVLVLRGDAGCGKSALLTHLGAAAAGFEVVRVSGVESEMELAFAGLQQLCAPMLGRLGRLPEPQRDALRAALGMRRAEAPDRFLVGLAVLSLIAETAERRPMLWLVDDAHWLDEASLQALGFVARRLLAEPIALVLAVRTAAADHHLAGLPTLTVGALGERDARALLASAVRGPLDEQVRDQIVSEARGNPLALLELPRGLTPEQLAGGFGLAGPHAVNGRMEENFLGRVGRLPPVTRLLLLVAAAEPTGDVPMLWRAAQVLGIGPGAAEAAQGASLLELGARVRFHHPLVRSAVYRAGAVADRRRVHAALAEATDPDVDPDRRAWHRAHAASGPDEEVAAELERCAGRAQARGGMAAAAAFHERAVALTADPARRRARAFDAVETALVAGSPDAALRLLAIAGSGPLDDLGRARADLLRGRISFATDRGSEAPALLLRAAQQLRPLDAGAARATCLEALAAATFAGRSAVGTGLREVARAARTMPPAPEPPRPADLLLDGLAVLFTEGYAEGRPILERAVRAFAGPDLPVGDQTRWLWLACTSAAELWDHDSWYDLSARFSAVVRDSGALGELGPALTMRAVVHTFAGEMDAAEALVDEAGTVVQATGIAIAPYGALALAAWRGREAEARELAGTVMTAVTARGEGTGIAVVNWALALLSNGLGRYDEAFAAGRVAAGSHQQLSSSRWGLVEVVEAAARTDRSGPAREALEQLCEATRASGTDWALGIEARSCALVDAGGRAEDLYREATERLARTRLRPELARAHLLHGEWLRRQQRRLDARVQLRSAYDLFSTLGIAAFADRAARELRATGETVRTRSVDTTTSLTAQETQVARFARDGLSNPEIGARLFLSPRTVEWHLGKVFAKLAITSRWELATALAAAGHP